MAKDIYDFATEYLTKLMSAGDKDGDMVVMPAVRKVVFNKPATIVLWDDGTKTVVKCDKYDVYDPFHGFCAAVTKKALGSSSIAKKIVDKYSTNEKTNTDYKDPRYCKTCVHIGISTSEKPCLGCYSTLEKPNYKHKK